MPPVRGLVRRTKGLPHRSFLSLARGAVLAAVCNPVPVMAQEPRFVDVTEAAGIDFVHENGAFGEKYLPETMGSGVAFFDADGDGDQDLLFVNSRKWPGHRTEPEPAAALYRNRGDGTFEDATAGSGLDAPLYGIGTAIADYDADGDQDVYLTVLGPNRLLENTGDGVFREAPHAAAVANPGFSSVATWLDADGDGDLDLFLLNYVEWSIEEDIFCALDGVNKSYCTPESYSGASAVLYRNDGPEGFTDVTKEAGLFNPRGKGLGVAVLDFDDDGLFDLAVANDTQPNYLYRNLGGGRFEDAGVLSGIAFAENGAARGAMGIDASDYDGDGMPDLVIGNFSNEMVSLYHNEGVGFFIDQAPVSEIGRNSLLTLAFGAFFFDYDLDGRQDIFIANGHVENDIAAVQQRVSYRQAPHLFRNRGDGGFEEVTTASPDLARAMVARGAAFGDIDGDGDPDLAVSENGGPARLFRNDGGERNGWVGFRLRGENSNRDGIGAKITLAIEDAGMTRSETRIVKSATGYASQNQLEVTFGLGSGGRAVSAEVRWPSGTRSEIESPAARRIHVLEEPPS
ncbi:MAG: CRTAC1 family protein [Acidobacteria bacterium]|nr:CRTAC1 family protein [Acidobacteriota bacterium]